MYLCHNPYTECEICSIDELLNFDDNVIKNNIVDMVILFKYNFLHF